MYLLYSTQTKPNQTHFAPPTELGQDQVVWHASKHGENGLMNELTDLSGLF